MSSNLPSCRQTAKKVARAAVPSRPLVVMALMAIGVALCGHTAAWAISQFHQTLGARVAHYATIFDVMPVWLLIGGVMNQVACTVSDAWGALNVALSSEKEDRSSETLSD
jgi:hypothetical protein